MAAEVRPARTVRLARRAAVRVRARREQPGALAAAPPPPPVAIARDARELLDEEVADGVSMPAIQWPTMVEERDPPQGGSEMGSELDDLEGMAANWAHYS